MNILIVLFLIITFFVLWCMIRVASKSDEFDQKEFEKNIK